METDDPMLEFHHSVDKELERVLHAPAFASAPVMSRLLRYLVGETLAGRGKRLKAYTVAVDALGRAPDFDALLDSYPRVQVGRLRKMLEAHYARNADPTAHCLFIRRGGYEVGVGRLDRAYPELAKTPAAAAAHFRPQSLEPATVAAASHPIQFALTLPKGIWMAVGMAGLGLGSALVAIIVYLLRGTAICSY